MIWTPSPVPTPPRRALSPGAPWSPGSPSRRVIPTTCCSWSTPAPRRSWSAAVTISRSASLRGGQPVAEAVLDGTCKGACTPEAKEAGEQALADAEARVAAGEDREHPRLRFHPRCTFYGSQLGRVEQAASRAFVLLSGDTPGPHDVPNNHFRASPRRFVTACSCRSRSAACRQPLGAVRAPGHDRQRRRRDRTASDGATKIELYRVTFPADDCAAPPVEQVSDAEAT